MHFPVGTSESQTFPDSGNLDFVPKTNVVRGQYSINTSFHKKFKESSNQAY